jgi:hypothetical protein
MFQLSYEVAHGDRRKATVDVLPLTFSESHALAEAAAVLSDQTYRLHKLTLVEVHVKDNVYVVKRTLLRYERDGL